MLKIILLIVVIMVETIPAQSIDNANFTCGKSTISYAGQTYHTVQIGSQCWLVENLNVGTMIDSMQEQTNNGVIEKYCYHDDPANCIAYGGLYQWGEAVKYQNGTTNTHTANPAFTGNVQGICPSGWHIPNQIEFDSLAITVNYNGSALKSMGQEFAQYKGARTIISGFSALLAGSRNNDGHFYWLWVLANFWSSTEYDAVDAYYWYLVSYDSGIHCIITNKVHGFSVRCMKD